MEKKEKRYLEEECYEEKRNVLQRLKEGDKSAFKNLFKYYKDIDFIDQVLDEVDDKNFKKIFEYVQACNMWEWRKFKYANIFFEFRINPDNNMFRCKVCDCNAKFEVFLKKLIDCFEILPNEETDIRYLLLNKEGSDYPSKTEAKGNYLESVIKYLSCKKRIKEIPNEIKPIFWDIKSHMNEQSLEVEFVKEILSENLPMTLKEEEIELLDAVYKWDGNLIRRLLNEKEFNSEIINFANAILFGINFKSNKFGRCIKMEKYLEEECYEEKRNILQRLKDGDKTAFKNLFKYYKDVDFIDYVLDEVDDEELTKIFEYIQAYNMWEWKEFRYPVMIIEYKILDNSTFRCEVCNYDAEFEVFLKKLIDCFEILPNEETDIRYLLLNKEGSGYLSRRRAKSNYLESVIKYLSCKKRIKEIPNEIKTIFWDIKSHMNEQSLEVEFVKEILSENLPMTLKEEEIELLDAAYRKDEDLLRRLLKEKEFSFKLIDFLKTLSARPLIDKVIEKRVALMYEAERGCIDEVEKLIEAGVDINIQNNDGKTALMLAVMKGHEGVINKLIQVGADLDIQDNAGKTGLIYAAEGVDFKILSMLIKAGAAINIQDNDGNTALMYIARKQCEKETREIIKAGAYVNIQDNAGKTALMYAAKRGWGEVVRELIEARVNVNIQDNDGKTALMYAAKYNEAWVVGELIEAGVDVNIQDNDGKTALMYVGQGKKIVRVDMLGQEKQYNVEIVRKLIKAGANLNAKDNEGNNILRYILKSRNLEVLRIALDKEFKLISNNKIIDVLLGWKKGYKRGFKLELALNRIDLNSADNKKVVKDFIENNPDMVEEVIKILVDNGLDKNKIMVTDVKSNEIQRPKIQHGELHNECSSGNKTEDIRYNI